MNIEKGYFPNYNSLPYKKNFKCKITTRDERMFTFMQKICWISHKSYRNVTFITQNEIL